MLAQRKVAEKESALVRASLKDFHFKKTIFYAPGNFSLLAQRKVAEKESALVRAPLKDFHFKKTVFYF